MGQNEPHVLALDIGTTTIRCYVYDRDMLVKGSASRKVELLHPAPGYVEMDPDTLWAQIKEVIREALDVAGAKDNDVTCLGITVQRNTFINWDRDTGEPFHRFITWQDLRASELVKSWNESYTMKGFSASTKVLHTVTRKKRFLSASVLRFKSAQVTMRLKWVLENNEKLREEAKKGNVQFGTLDTWLLWKLTDGKEIATEYSSASATGIYDAFNLEWSPVVCGLVGLPKDIFPPIKDTSTLFGTCSAELFGSPIPITAMVADQQGAMFGQGCFNEGDINLTMGTGTFIDSHTGNKPHASVAGLYPLIGWKIGEEVVFIAEGMASDTGRCVEWLKELGIFEDVSETSDLAESVPDSNGTYFIPAFSGLQTPINDDKACASIIGIKPNTSKEHIVRAVLESLAFRSKLLFDTVLDETKTELKTSMRVDGGVCNNDFLMQLTADLLGVSLDRPSDLDMASVGAAFLAGLAVGIWKSKEELIKLRKGAKIFEPQPNRLQDYKGTLAEWERAMKRTLGWYKNINT